MSVNNRKGPIVDPGVCRCCGCTKKCRLLNVEYEWLGQKEIYSDLFVDTFGLLLSHLDGDSGLICATCVSRLRDACAFRRQVLRCEEKLLQAKIHFHGAEVPLNTEVKLEDEPKGETTECTSRLQLNDADDDDINIDPGDCDIEHDSDNKTIVVKGEKIVKPAKRSVKKERKSPKSVKRKTAKPKAKGDKSKGRKEMLIKMKRMGEKLEKMQQMEEPPEPATKPGTKKPKIVSTTDNDLKAFQNTVTIVETSYVCPFDTSFSDYYCWYCRQVFTDPNKLREHNITHNPLTFKEMVSNKKIPQIDIQQIDCRLCLERIDNLDDFKSHITNAHGKTLHKVTNEFLKFKLTANNLTCTECGSTFSFFHALKKHMAEHFGTCICDVCGAHYFEERMLILHQKTHQRIEENFPCKDCGKTFKSKHSRYLHEARMHKKEPAYQCPKCDELFHSYTLRYRHMIETHGEERTFQCDHCDRAYDSRKSLREHNRRFHLKIFKHQCDLCDKRFYLPSRLKEHMATHTGERNFRCEYCGKSYPRLRGLKVHMQSHSTEKKYRCMLCTATFTQNVNLKNHVKRQHPSVEMEEGFHG